LLAKSSPGFSGGKDLNQRGCRIISAFVFIRGLKSLRPRGFALKSFPVCRIFSAAQNFYG
jgi:hypothetical protein